MQFLYCIYCLALKGTRQILFFSRNFDDEIAERWIWYCAFANGYAFKQIDSISEIILIT